MNQEVEDAWREAWLQYKSSGTRAESARMLFLAGWCQGVQQGIKWTVEEYEGKGQQKLKPGKE